MTCFPAKFLWPHTRAETKRIFTYLAPTCSSTRCGGITFSDGRVFFDSVFTTVENTHLKQMKEYFNYHLVQIKSRLNQVKIPFSSCDLRPLHTKTQNSIVENWHEIQNFSDLNLLWGIYTPKAFWKPFCGKFIPNAQWEKWSQHQPTWSWRFQEVKVYHGCFCTRFRISMGQF